MKHPQRRRPWKKLASGPSLLERINPTAAGIDCGAAEHYVAVPADRDAAPVRAFKTFTTDLHRLADWLMACGVTTVAMESTGVYWIPLYEILDARGIDVVLVNARHVKNVPGRKSDVVDCQWLQELHSVGLLRGSFPPTAAIAALRAYLRHRETVVESAATHVQRMQKALVQMNLQLSIVISDITGVTGLRIVRAIIAGQTDPHALAQHRDYRCQASEIEIMAALTGHYRPEHVFVLQQNLELFERHLPVPFHRKERVGVGPAVCQGGATAACSNGPHPRRAELGRGGRGRHRQRSAHGLHGGRPDHPSRRPDRAAR
jgi:transposase